MTISCPICVNCTYHEGCDYYINHVKPLIDINASGAEIARGLDTAFEKLLNGFNPIEQSRASYIMNRARRQQLGGIIKWKIKTSHS